MNIDAMVNQIQEQIRKNIIQQWPSRIHGRDARMVQHIKICQCNPPHKQTARKFHVIISLDGEKVSDKIQHPFMIKVLKRAGIQETYLNIIKAIYTS